MTLNGADVAELRTAATHFTTSASALETSAKALHSLIGGGTKWRGPDAERFRSEWANVSARTIAAAVASLRGAADELADTYNSIGELFDASTDGKWDEAQRNMSRFYRRPAVAEF
jgi:hypothetical protein